MSKRYVESTMFTDPWFRKLSPSAKLLWSFLCASCDNSGVWERDDDYCKYLTGLENELQELLSELGDRVVHINDEKLLLPKFILFQQGKTLSNAKPPHRGIIKLLLKHDLEMDENGITKPKVNLPLTKANPKVSQEVTKPLVTSKGKGNSKGNGKGGMGETPRPGESSLPRELDLPEFHQVWDKWVAYRRERKLPAYKSLGLSALRTRLVAYVNSHGLPAVIVSMHSSIANNYNGIFEPKSPKRLDPNSMNYENPFEV